MEGIARGQLFNATVTIQIYLKSKGTGFNPVGEDFVFTGISTSDYQFKTPAIDLENREPPFYLGFIKN